MIKVAIIINPKSGKGSGEDFIEKLKSFKVPNSVNLTIYITEYPLHATSIAENISKEFDRIIIAGGDGTLNEFVNGFDVESNTSIGLLPIGSGNDFSLSLYKDKINIDKILMSYLSENIKLLKTDFGMIKLTESNGNIILKRFINSLGIGFDARVAYLNQTNKIFSGSLSYLISILRTFVKFNSIKFNIKIGDKRLNRNALFCSIGNGESVGAGLYLMPGAQIDDGYLDLSIVDLKSRIKLLKLLPKAAKNEIKGIPELEQMRFKKLEIVLETPYYSHVDGEIVSSKTKEIEVNVLREALTFMILE
ncbi:Transcription regulator [contains diacylglycerol kinase catalytic domain] [hydrothermal vent metagenome]|uniref:Transcription regulator [contains diacylglycerol kinase catalytic domain] n=1 Tax=hydrothermal vent metagenome TaxID=652676 RepID=A0A3B1C8H1_9ZZZZ